VKLVENESGPIYYTLVLSRYEKLNTIFYSLCVYSTSQFELKELKDNYNQQYFKMISGIGVMKLLVDVQIMWISF
jgi:hypothetical protein